MKKYVLLALLLLSIVLGIIYRDSLDLLYIKDYILSYGLLAPLVFIAIYICFTVLVLPGSILTVLGGVIFGAWGIVINLVAAVLGATTTFVIARYISQDLVKAYLLGASNANKLKQTTINIMMVVNQNGWQVVALLRLIPLVPFNLLNYILGLTTIPLRVYFITSAIFMLPGTIAYTYIGILGEKALSGDLYSIFKTLLLVISMFFGLYLLIRIIKQWRHKDIAKLKIGEG